ncbi:hypothetical protein D9M71_774650 [compost metagenome]
MLGDEVERVQTILVAAQCQPGQELLNSGIPRPDRNKDQVSLFVTDAGVGHQVGALVDAIQRGRR